MASRRIINHLAVNRVSGAWRGPERAAAEPARADSTGSGAGGAVRSERFQVSLYYGAKQVFSRFDELDVSGFTDHTGFEARYDLTPRVDLGLQASVLHSWSAGTLQGSFGSSVGFSPLGDAWLTLGYNVRGFRDAELPGC